MSTLILRPAPVATHPHDLRIELPHNFHQVFLRGHHLANVLVNAWHFIRTRRNDVYPALFQFLAYRLKAKHIVRLPSAHPSPRAVRGRIETLRVTPSAYHKRRVGHG